MITAQARNSWPHPASFPSGQLPTAATWSQFMDSVRQIALAHANALPDFVCTQNIKRLAKFGENGDWALVDQIVAEVSYSESREHHRILTIDNRPPPPKTDTEIPGFSSEGDFGNALYLLFAPESNASFVMEGPSRVNSRNTVRTRFHIGLGDQKVTTAYGGHCWIDLSSLRAVRLEAEAKDIPEPSPSESPRTPPNMT